MQENKVKRGEIYIYDYGTSNTMSVQSGIRPVLVIQCNKGNTFSPTTVIAAITCSIKKQYLPTHVMLGPNFGLAEPSMVMLEQLKTVNQSELKSYVGKITDKYILKQIDTGLKKSMGLWISKPVNSNNIRCLCNKCLNDYINTNSYFIKRLDPFSSTKEQCDKCEGMGYEYIVIDKKPDE